MGTFSAPLHTVTKFGAFTPDALTQLLAGGYSMGALFGEFAQDNVTATGSTQAGAFQTTAQTIRLTTVAANTGILLPPSFAGLEVLVINHGANACQCYGSGTDTIDDVATATGVSQMANSLVIYTCATAGKWYSEGLATGYGGSGLQTVSFADNVSAAGTTQGTATVLVPRMITNVTTIPASSGVLLPASAAGMVLTINLAVAVALSIYPNGSEKINALAASAPLVTSAATQAIIFYCFTAGQWWSK